MSPPVRIACWSGPRNVSTALMRSWGARSDTVVCDEPLYAHYLHHTGRVHPGAERIMAHHETNAEAVIATLVGPVPENAAIFYQKHMAHHLLPYLDGDWLEDLQHVFLIREPAAMLTSLLKVLPDATLADTGLPQQVRLFDRLHRETGTAPAVLDARCLLSDPQGVLAALCSRLSVPFSTAMLSWAPGRRVTDGIWADIWYHSVEQSTTFAPYTEKPISVPDDKHDLLTACEEAYARLRPWAIEGPASL